MNYKNYLKEIFIFSFFIFIIISGFAQNYEGKIGNYPVFIQISLNRDNGQLSGFYFYKSRLNNINLDGYVKGEKIIAFKKYTEEKDRIELFKLKRNKNRLIGFWQNKSKTLPVELIKTNQEPSQLKLQKFKFKRDSIQNYDSRELVWFIEKYSKKSMFRLGNGFTKNQREFLNPKLDSIHLKYAEIELECGVDNLDVVVKTISERYVSFLERYSFFCGGAHPVHGQVGHNFDMKKLIPLNRISEIYPDLDYFIEIKNKYKNNVDLQEECSFFDDSRHVWEYCEWVLTKEGIAIIPQYPHSMTPCEEEFILTYEELEK